MGNSPRCACLRGRSPHAFTLLEMLVALSIIVLLIALLLPALQRARATAESVFCLSNLRQVGLAWEMYAQDNNELIVGAMGVHGPREGTPRESWPYPTYHNSSFGVPFTYFLSRYIDAGYDHLDAEKTSDIYWCPTNRRKGVTTTQPHDRDRPGNYSANGQFGHPELWEVHSGPVVRNLRRDRVMDHADKRPAIFDALLDESGGIARQYHRTPFGVADWMNPAHHLDRWAHDGAWSILWADQHATTTPPDQLSSGMFDVNAYDGWSTGPAHATFGW